MHIKALQMHVGLNIFMSYLHVKKVKQLKPRKEEKIPLMSTRT